MRFVPTIMLRLVLLLSMCMLLSSAFARVDFNQTQDFYRSGFTDQDKITEMCNAPAAASFWCSLEDEKLTLIAGKDKDSFFNQAGEIVAVYAKQQKGQDNRGKYGIDRGPNVIPINSVNPGGAILIDGEYLKPENAKGSWQQTDQETWTGTFSFTAGSNNVQKVITLKNTTNIIGISYEIDGTGIASVVFPGITRESSPIVRVGQGANADEGGASENPLQDQAVTNPSYVSFQTGPVRGQAIIMTPTGDSSKLEASSLANRRIALSTDLASNNKIDIGVYTGQNELIRLYQAGLHELPQLFKPNIFGRLSLMVINLLETIHRFVPNWGLSIITLTLLFRVLVWPLINTQTKSMVGMQQLQPKLKKLQEKHKKDRQKLTEETMKLYKEAGVNPAGGCLPMLLQMPLFIVFWRIFANFEFAEGFLWIPDLGLSDPIYLLPILYVVIMIGQSLLMSKGNPQSLQQQLIMNLVFAFILFRFPAGVLLYLVTNMAVQVGQHWWIQRNADAKPKMAKA